ncbi:MAG: tRNA (guanosine(37)-N1)-methyltransferase TrmD [Candidatus Omnitrophota bacterium]|nr:tRNA (guanosine(37)-N1)-methyltransferase TrmD [Candidatus Omnitrophota bacterium]
MLQFYIITIFPKVFEPILNESIIKRAQEKGLVKINLYNLRDFSLDKHKKVDDRPFGGGPGMVMKPEPIFRAVEHIKHRAKIILLSPRGEKLNQKIAKELSKERQLILICGHYEGVDERVKKIIDREISIGDYVLTGGEIPAMVLVDAVTRLVPGVLGDEDSLSQESFEENLLEYPHYTRPAVFKGMKVPEVLISGNHQRIAKWRQEKALKHTKAKRPDLLKKNRLNIPTI